MRSWKPRAVKFHLGYGYSNPFNYFKGPQFYDKTVAFSKKCAKS